MSLHAKYYERLFQNRQEMVFRPPQAAIKAHKSRLQMLQSQ